MKQLLLSIAFFFIAIQIFAQDWTIRLNDNWDAELKVINSEEWNRLLKQKEFQSQYAILEYIDNVELENEGLANVIKGKRPQLKGHYYLLATLIPKTEEAKILQNLTGYTQMLTYGNDKTGNFGIIFLNEVGSVLTVTDAGAGAVEVNSKEYVSRYNQFIGWVNGE
jgi:hypothetical protein